MQRIFKTWSADLILRAYTDWYVNFLICLIYQLLRDTYWNIPWQLWIFQFVQILSNFGFISEVLFSGACTLLSLDSGLFRMSFSHRLSLPSVSMVSTGSILTKICLVLSLLFLPTFQRPTVAVSLVNST